MIAFPSSPSEKAPSPPARQQRVYTSLVVVATILWTLWWALRWPRDTAPPKWRHGNNPRAWIRTVGDNHSGLGSVIGQHRMAAVLADMFNSTLVVPRGPSGHGYSVSDYLNNLLEVSPDLSAPCLVSQLKWRGTMEENVQKYCQDGTPPVLTTDITHCSSFLDDREWDYRRDLAWCSMDYLDAVLEVPSPVVSAEKVVTVALHVRWGDTEGRIGFDAGMGDPDTRSINQQTAIKIVNKIRQCIPSAEVHVYKENASDLGDLAVIKGAILHNKSDMMGDLRRIADADIRMTALGGFASMINWGAKHGLSLTPTTKMVQYYKKSPRITVQTHQEFLEDSVTCEQVIAMARSPEKIAAGQA